MFVKKSDALTGHAAFCKDCYSQYRKEYAKRKPEIQLKRNAKNILVHGSLLRHSEIPDCLVAAKVEQLKIIRLIKEMKK